MGKWLYYIFVLILVYLLIVYYKGTKAVGGTMFSGIQGTIGMLQGRSTTGGNPAAYPAG